MCNTKQSHIISDLVRAWWIEWLLFWQRGMQTLCQHKTNNKFTNHKTSRDTGPLLPYDQTDSSQPNIGTIKHNGKLITTYHNDTMAICRQIPTITKPTLILYIYCPYHHATLPRVPEPTWSRNQEQPSNLYMSQATKNYIHKVNIGTSDAETFFIYWQTI